MILRFFSGSLTPGEFAPGNARWHRRPPGAGPACHAGLLHFLKFIFAQHAVVHEYAGQARCPLASRMARSTSMAATAESTPPESAQIARPLPTGCRTLVDGRVNEMLRSPCGLSPANHESKLLRIWCRAACGGPRDGTAPRTSSSLCSGFRPPRGVSWPSTGSRAAIRRLCRRATSRPPVSWASCETSTSRTDVHFAWPYSRLSAARTLPPSVCTMSCNP